VAAKNEPLTLVVIEFGRMALLCRIMVDCENFQPGE